MAENQEVLKLIERAAKGGLTDLNLRDTQLTSLPPEITKLTNLTSLYLRGNQLPIPPERWPIQMT